MLAQLIVPTTNNYKENVYLKFSVYIVCHQEGNIMHAYHNHIALSDFEAYYNHLALSYILSSLRKLWRTASPRDEQGLNVSFNNSLATLFESFKPFPKLQFPNKYFLLSLAEELVPDKNCPEIDSQPSSLVILVKTLS